MSDHDNRIELAQVVMQILDDWDVTPEDQSRLLGLPEKTRPRSLKRYRQGDPLPDDSATQRRMSCVLSIQKSLQTALPHNAAMAHYWVTSPNPYFEDRTPLDVMLAEGLPGMERVVETLAGRSQW